MNLTVTQDNLYLFLPSKTSRLAEIISEDNGVNIVNALKMVYNSDTYIRLENENSNVL